MPANVVAFILSVAASIFWAVLGVVLLVGAFKLFDMIDPIDYRREIEKGNMAAGIVMAGVMIGMAIIIYAAIQ
jgi:uncharacterized membrane protein YjfL (UPF0719 family)